MRRRRGVLAACTMGNAIGTTPSVHAVFGLFLVPLSQTFGWPRASISAVLGIIALTGAIVYPLAGRYVDRHGARWMLLGSITLFALSVAALALTNGSLAQFYLTFTAIGIFGAAAGTPIFSKVVADWYRRDSGTALGISAGLGSGVGAMLIPMFAAAVLAGAGWRAAYLAIAALVLLATLTVLLPLLKDAPRASGEHALVAEEEGLSLPEASRTLPFWLILVAVPIGAGVLTAIFSHVVPILGERGLGVATGTAVVSAFALIGSSWQIVTGRLLDRVQGPHIVAPMVLMAVAGLALLAKSVTLAPLILAGALLGIALGGLYGALPYYIARYFGLRAFGTIIGVMYSAAIAAQGTTPILFDASFDHLHSYRAALIVAGAGLACGALLLLALPAYRMARRSEEELAMAGFA